MSGFFTWGRIAALAGVGLAAAGVAYLLRTEKGRAMLKQAREKAREAFLKARQGTQSATEALQASSQSALNPAEQQPEEQPAT